MLYPMFCPGGHKFEFYARGALNTEAAAVTCPTCQQAAVLDENEWYNKPKGTTAQQTTGKAWSGRQGQSLGLVWDTSPAAREELKRQCPSAELNENGTFRFRSDSHQRKVLKELADAKERLLNDDPTALDPEPPSLGITRVDRPVQTNRR